MQKKVGKKRRHMALYAADIGPVKDGLPAQCLRGERPIRQPKRTGLGLEGFHKRSERVQVSGQACVGLPEFGMRLPVLNQARAGLQLPDGEFKVLDLIPVRTPVQGMGVREPSEVGGVPGTIGKLTRSVRPVRRPRDSSRNSSSGLVRPGLSGWR